MEKSCLTCKHWEPLFKGDAWGVRAFSQAPEAEKARCIEYFAKQEKEDGYRDPSELDGYKHNFWSISYSDPRDWWFWGECKIASLNYLEEPTRLAYALDSSNYSAALRTKETFSCCQWEPV